MRGEIHWKVETVTSERREERRARTRVQFNRQIRILVEGRRLAVVSLRDISLNGVFVITEDKAEVGEQCQLIIDLAAEGQEPRLIIDGVVTRVKENGLGIQFTEMDPDSFFHLRNIVLYNAPDPDQVEAEIERPGFK